MASHDSHSSGAHREMRLSRFDQVSALLMTLVLFFGVFVLLMFIIWLTERLQFKGGEIRVAPVENPAGRGENAEGFERDFEPPGAEEVEDLLEPTLQDTLTAVTDAASTVAASLDSMDTNAVANSQGTGMGDSRPPGPEGEGDDIIPRFERWQLKFAAKNAKGYASQLDHYEIELGVVGGQVQGVDYAHSFSGGAEHRYSADSGAEERTYFRWTQDGELAQYDRQLLQQAGIALDGRYILMFIPKPLEDELAIMELDYAREQGHESVKEIAKTVFESTPGGSGYQFRVIDQRYRNVGG